MKKLENAKGIYYSSLLWSVKVDTCLQATEKTPSVIPGVTETFSQALAEFNTYYKNEHIVVAGETLGTLARRYYGDPSKWNDIFQTNQALLESRFPNASITQDTEIRPAGQPEILLKIPSVSAQ